MYQKEVLGTGGFQNLEEGAAANDNHAYNNNMALGENIATSTAIEDDEGNISI